MTTYLYVGIVLAVLGIVLGAWESWSTRKEPQYVSPMKSKLFWVLIILLAVPFVNIVEVLVIGYLLYRDHVTRKSEEFMDSVFDSSWFDHSHSPLDSDWGDHE